MLEAVVTGESPRYSPGVEQRVAEPLSEVSAYWRLCDELAWRARAPAARWTLFRRLAMLRQTLGAVDAAAPSVPGVSRGEVVWRRGSRLLTGILAHFEDDALLTTAAAYGWCGCRRAAALCSELWHKSSWDQSRLRVAHGGGHLATTQEDVLTQQLARIARDHELAQLEDVLTWVRLMRARDNALACWERVAPVALESYGVPQQPLMTVSLGAGWAQFEELLARRTGAQVLACDTEDRPRFLDADSAVRFSKARAEQLVAELNGETIDMFVLKDVLHHTQDPEQIIGATWNPLRPGGVLLVIEPVYCEDDAISLMVMQELDSTPYPASFRSRQRMQQVFAELGYHTCRRMDFASGVIDNNDGFPRSAWVLRKP